MCLKFCPFTFSPSFQTGLTHTTPSPNLQTRLCSPDQKYSINNAHHTATCQRPISYLSSDGHDGKSAFSLQVCTVPPVLHTRHGFHLSPKGSSVEISLPLGGGSWREWKPVSRGGTFGREPAVDKAIRLEFLWLDNGTSWEKAKDEVQRQSTCLIWARVSSTSSTTKRGILKLPIL